jgi:flagellar hook-length control protein FliK
MKAFAIATNDVRIQKSGLAMLMKALDKISTEKPHLSQDVSFAGILNKRKGTAATPAPILDKNNPATNDPDMTAELIGKSVAADAPAKANQIKDFTILFPSGDNEATQADSKKSPVSILADEMSFPAFTDTVFTKTSNSAPPAPVIALALLASTPAIIEAADNVLNEETAFSGKAADSEQTAKHPLTSESVKMEKTDAATMNPAALLKEGAAAPGNTADSERTAEAGLETESADEDRMARQHPTKDARNPVESKFMERGANLLLQKEGSPAPENILSQVNRAVVPTLNDNLSTLSPKDAEHPAAKHNPATVVHNERDLTSKSVFSGRAESTVELPDRAVAMKEGATATGHDANIDKNRTLTLARTANPAEPESFPFRVESLSTASSPETKAPLSDTPGGSRTQAIIDQIIDARQAMNGDFGRIRVVLSPPNLGTVDLDIVVRNERVEVVMKADNSSVQQALQSRADDIRIALQRHDLKIEAFQVLLHDHEANQQQTSGGALFEQRREHQEKQNLKDSSPMLSANPSIPSILSLSSMERSGPARGMVSIFV